LGWKIFLGELLGKLEAGIRGGDSGPGSREENRELNQVLASGRRLVWGGYWYLSPIFTGSLKKVLNVPKSAMSTKIKWKKKPGIIPTRPLL